MGKETAQGICIVIVVTWNVRDVNFNVGTGHQEGEFFQKKGLKASEWKIIYLTRLRLWCLSESVEIFFCPSPLPFGGSAVLSPTRGPAGNRTATGSLSAPQE